MARSHHNVKNSYSFLRDVQYGRLPSLILSVKNIQKFHHEHRLFLMRGEALGNN